MKYIIWFVLWALRSLGLRKKATVTYNDDGTFSVDRIDPGEKVTIEITHLK